MQPVPFKQFSGLARSAHDAGFGAGVGFFVGAGVTGLFVGDVGDDDAAQGRARWETAATRQARSQRLDILSVLSVSSLYSRVHNTAYCKYSTACPDVNAESRGMLRITLLKDFERIFFIFIYFFDKAWIAITFLNLSHLSSSRSRTIGMHTFTSRNEGIEKWMEETGD